MMSLDGNDFIIINIKIHSLIFGAWHKGSQYNIYVVLPISEKNL
jgi:hypothetical protein